MGKGFRFLSILLVLSIILSPIALAASNIMNMEELEESFNDEEITEDIGEEKDSEESKDEIEDTEDTVLTDRVGLRIANGQERINNALEEVKQGFLDSNDKYEYSTAMGLKLIGVDEDRIAGNATRYSQYFTDNNRRAKDIMMAIAIGQDPKDYHGKNYVQELLDNNFYEDANPEWLVDAILALDMAGADYDEGRAISALLDKMINNSGRYYIEYTNNNNPNNGLTALSLIALSKHRDVEGVEAAIKGIKNHLEDMQDENGLIVNCEAHSFAIQGLIASGEDIYSDRWTKEDEYGNSITLFDALLSLKTGHQFKVLPDNPWPSSGQEVFGFSALVDLSLNDSMYYQLENLGPREFTIEIQGDSEELTIDRGETVELEVQLLENGEHVDREVIWESLDDTIAEVDDGTIRALKAGQTTVRVKLKSFEDIYDEITVKVVEVIGGPESIIIEELNGDSPIIKGDKFKLEANVLDELGNQLENIEIEWTSSNDEVLSIDKDGNAIAHESGSVRITVKIKDKDIEDRITIRVFENQEEVNNTLDKFIDIIKEYYETIYFTENQGQLDAWESATLTRAGMDLKRWYTNENYAPSYDSDLQYLGNKANQTLIMLDLDKNPTSYKGRNLIEEIIGEIGNEDYGHGDQKYLRAVMAVDRYNEKYQEKKIDYNEGIVINNILSAQTEEGGFKERGNDSVPLNTGYALNALSRHREYAGVEESIDNAIGYLQSVQKDDGAFYTSTFVTANNAEIISGLLSVGEDLSSDKWAKGDKNPIESMFILWKDNGSFGNMEGESENNRPWTTATQKSLYTLVDLKETGYSDYIVRREILSDVPEELEETLDVYTAIVVDRDDYYEIMSDPKKVTINTKLHNRGLTALGSLHATTPLYEMTGSMVTSIYGIANQGLGGWLYTVNDEMLGTTADKVILKDGDKVVWFYSAKGMNAEIPTWAELPGDEEEGELTIKIIVDRTSVREGQELPLSAEVRKGDAILNDKEIMWISSNAEIATIEGGKLIGHKAGEVNITAALVEDKNIQDSIKIKVAEDNNEPVLEEVIEALREYYFKKDNFTFRAALAYHHTSDDLEWDLIRIDSKFKTNEAPTSASEHVGNIMGLIASGRDPYNYKGKDYVKDLIGSQNEEGKFIVGFYDDYPTTVAFSVLALDMAGADYNKNKAIDALLSYQDPTGNFAGVDETGMVLAALAKDKNESGVQTAIDKGLNYLKEEQDESTGGFIVWGGENPYSAAAVLQGLVAVGEDPLSEEWTKNGKTIVDSLMNFYKDDHFENVSEWGRDIDSITEQAFMAVADLYRGKSMFKETKLSSGELSRIQLYMSNTNKIVVGDSRELYVMGYDENSRIMLVDEIIWTSSDTEIAEIDQDGNVSFKKPGRVSITAKVKDKNIEDTIELTVYEKEFEVEYIGDTEALKGSHMNGKVRIKNLTEDKKPATLIVTLYDKDMKILYNYSTMKKELDSKEEFELSAGFLVPESGDYYIKVFLWDDLQSQNIIMRDSIELEIAN